MKLEEVQQQIAQVDVTAGQDLVYELLAAYGIPQASITKLRTGTYDKSSNENTVLWKSKVWDTYLPDADNDELLATLDRAQANNDIKRLKPRFYIARNDQHLAAVDARLGQTLDIDLSDLWRHTAFLMPWTGAEKVRSETTTYVDTKVAQEMAKLYDEIIATNPDLPTSTDGRRDLNIFFSRLLFCFFAEDTGVFDDGIFTDIINRLTATDGTDTAPFLDELFIVLDTPVVKRREVPSHFEAFGYVNGSLFSTRIAAPNFSRRARNIVIDCGTLDWSAINPDIFGSMIQAVTAGEERSNLGMHYTSVENILKVLNPLFLDELEERFASSSDSAAKLEALLDHLGDVRVFDPACGSGNFLIVAYKRLRSLEHRILQRLSQLNAKVALFAESRISLENFYGIEIDDFAHDIAKLSLWFAKHQMNGEYDDLFGIERPLIPLTETGAIVCSNAIRTDWESVCRPTGTTFVCGNPPFSGWSNLVESQQQDFAVHFDGGKYSKQLDYVSLWFLKGTDYICNSESQMAFVSTNSICQGQHVELLWTQLLALGVEISFAHTSFLWSNQATRNAGVSCVIIGLANKAPSNRSLYTAGVRRRVPNINPYLVASADNTIVKKRSKPLSRDAIQLTYGSQPVDDGHLVVADAEHAEMLERDSRAAEFLRQYVGSDELINAKRRFCVWVSDDDATRAREIPAVGDRIDLVESYRANSEARDAPKWADRPHRFVYIKYQDQPCVAIPAVSSERREYLPLGFFPTGTVLSNQVFAAYGAEPWLFGLLHSSMHMAWVRAVCGRHESRYRFSHTLGYNTFPFPRLNDGARRAIDETALAILASRERWPDRSLAELYDPDQMPANLRAAHEANDAYVDSLYRSKPFQSDADRMEVLLAMYRSLVAEQDPTNEKSKKG